MKRYIGLILAAVMLLAAIPASAYDPYIMAKGECGVNGDNLTWTLSSDGTLTISGEGAIDSSSSEIFYDYELDIKSIIFENGVTAIGGFTFANFFGITDVTIPDSVITIEDGAFQNCKNLTNITIADGVKYIGDLVFFDTAYYDNEENWENRVLYIGNHLIAMGARTGNYIIRPGTLTIAGGAFYKCSLKEITIPDGVITIGRSAFSRCNSLEKISIPVSVATIGESAFSGCESLADVYYGGSKEQWNRIQNGAFFYDATIHFGIASTKIASLGATAGDGVITVVLEAENIPETAAVFITACGKDGTPAKTNSAAPENGRITTEFTDDAITKVKAFIWDAETLRPLCEAKEAEVVTQ